MVRRKQKTPRKKRVRWFDQIQAEASRPRQSYSPPNVNEAEIMKVINKEAAKQRRAKVKRMAGVAVGQQALRSYTASQKKQRRRASRHPPMRRQKPGRQKTCLTLMELAGPFQTLRSKCAFIPNNRPSIHY